MTIASLEFRIEGGKLIDFIQYGSECRILAIPWEECILNLAKTKARHHQFLTFT